ncbi:MAG: hypothetical protein JNJ58_04150 [Chitinophagaceae bacterium]|nr:hypothetical protein [Chitinophagaceae bacterium]
MTLSVCTATKLEQELLKTLDIPSGMNVNWHVHGIGCMMAGIHLSALLQNKPDILIQCGLAGAYTENLRIGESVIVQTECMGDTGAEDHDQLLDLYDLGLLGQSDSPFVLGKLPNHHNTLFPPNMRLVNGLSVNLTAGSIETIQKRKAKFNPDIETMEGAALHYVGLIHHIPFIQLRTISNRVLPRDKSLWDIPKALEENRNALGQLFQHLYTLI